MAILNITYNGMSVDYPRAIEPHMGDREIRRIAVELVRSGGLPGLHIANLHEGAFDHYVIDRFGHGRIYLRPKVPFGRAQKASGRGADGPAEHRAAVRRGTGSAAARSRECAPGRAQKASGRGADGPAEHRAAVRRGTGSAAARSRECAPGRAQKASGRGADGPAEHRAAVRRGTGSAAARSRECAPGPQES